MTNKIERLRELVRRAESSEHYWQQQASAMEFAAHGDWLLDRLEKLEAVYAAAMKDSYIGYALCDALAAVEEKE